MKKFLVIMIAAIMCSVSAGAQEYNRDVDGKFVYGSYETNKVFDNWFVNVGGGAQTVADNVRLMFKDGMTYDFGGLALVGEVGKWVDPVWGFKFGWQGLTTGNLDENILWKDSFAKEHAFNYVHADAMVNLMNLFGGYKETRAVSLNPYISAGYAFNRFDKSPALGGGMEMPIRLSNRVFIVPDVRVLTMNNEIFGGNAVTTNASATVGVRVNLGKTNWRRTSTTAAKAAANYMALESAYNEMHALYGKADARAKKAESALHNANNELNNLRKQLASYSAPKQVVDPHGSFTTYFEIGKDVLSTAEEEHLVNWLDNVVGNAKSLTLTMYGAADSFTGTPDRNDRLADARAEYVQRLLETRYAVFNVKVLERKIDIHSNHELSRAVVISY